MLAALGSMKSLKEVRIWSNEWLSGKREHENGYVPENDVLIDARPTVRGRGISDYQKSRSQSCNPVGQKRETLFIKHLLISVIETFNCPCWLLVLKIEAPCATTASNFENARQSAIIFTIIASDASWRNNIDPIRSCRPVVP